MICVRRAASPGQGALVGNVDMYSHVLILRLKLPHACKIHLRHLESWTNDIGHSVLQV